MITALSLAAMFLLAVDGQVFPSILTRLGGSSVQEGLLLAALFVFFPLSSVAAGTLSDRIGKRGVVAAGILLVASSFAFSGTFADIRARTLAVLLFGLGGGVVESQISALLSDLNPNRERAVMNLSQTMFSAGAAGGPFLITLVSTLHRELSLSPLLWTVAGINFLLFGLFILGPLLPGPRRGAAAAKLSTHSTARAIGQHPREDQPGERLPLLREPLLWILAAGVFLYVAAEMGTAGWLAKFGETELGLRRELAPLCLTLFWGGLGVSRTVLGVGRITWSDRAVLVGSLILTLAGQAAAFTLRSPWAVMVAIATAGFGMGGVWPTLVALAAARFRRSSGTAVGIVVAAGALAIPIVQLLVGQLSRPGLLGLRNSLLGLSLLTLLDLVLVLVVFRRSGGGMSALNPRNASGRETR
jgi:FHS family glucose/mannose:H+ symporter-like MFS transporter